MRSRLWEQNFQPNCIIAFFHQDFFFLPHSTKIVAKTHNFLLLVSPHADGEIVHQICLRYGIEGIKSSSKQKPLAGYRKLLKLALQKKTNSPIFAVDGPTGPYHTIHQGVIAMAHATKKPIQVIFTHSNSYFEFKKAWDKFRVPYPFSAVNIYISKPFYLQFPPTEEKSILFETGKKQLRKCMLNEEAIFHARLRENGILPRQKP